MSSITERFRSRRGQVLPIFAFGMIGILAIAALVFDVGRDLLARRQYQNVADSAALAGARYLVTTNDSMSGLNCKSLSTNAACQQAEQAARDLAARHGFVDGVNGTRVQVNIPPTAESPFSGIKNHIQVVVDTNLPSIFSGLLGIDTHRIAARAVAGNTSSYSVPYAILALNEHNCGAGKVGGGGTITVNADIMVNSDCTTSGAMQVDGSTALITGSNCNSVGTYKVNPDGSPTVTCSFNPGTTAQPDPLVGLQPPSISALDNPPAVPIITGTGSNSPPNGCPGSASPASSSNIVGCDITFNRDKVVRIFPGVYWGGLRIRETSADLIVYMEPGIYYMAGGGFEVSGAVTLRSVQPTADDSSTTYGGGVLIFNGDAPGNKCATLGGKACIGPVDFQTTVGADVDLHALDEPNGTYDRLLVYQQRNASSQPALKVSGLASMTLEGTVYLPEADFVYTGNGAGEIFQAQVICDEFSVTGNGTLNVQYDPDEAAKFKGVGLVE